MTTVPMATTTDLEALGFVRCGVAATRTGIDHPGDAGLGPFCRLAVEDSAPVAPGVYAWTVDGHVTYVGKAKELCQITQGQRMGRAYNDYTYIPPSQARNASDPRARVNGQLNAAIVAGATVTWWWRELASEDDAFGEEARLIRAWNPPWNRARPTGARGR